MNKLFLIVIICFLAGSYSFARFIDSSKDLLTTDLDIPFKRIGTIKPKNVLEIEVSNWSKNGTDYKSKIPVYDNPVLIADFSLIK